MPEQPDSVRLAVEIARNSWMGGVLKGAAKELHASALAGGPSLRDEIDGFIADHLSAAYDIDTVDQLYRRASADQHTAPGGLTRAARGRPELRASDPANTVLNLLVTDYFKDRVGRNTPALKFIATLIALSDFIEREANKAKSKKESSRSGVDRSWIELAAVESVYEHVEIDAADEHADEGAEDDHGNDVPVSPEVEHAIATVAGFAPGVGAALVAVGPSTVDANYAVFFPPREAVLYESVDSPLRQLAAMADYLSEEDESTDETVDAIAIAADSINPNVSPAERVDQLKALPEGDLVKELAAARESLKREAVEEEREKGEPPEEEEEEELGRK